MSDGFTKTLTVANSGTTTEWFTGKGYTLVGLVLPTMTSTTVEFEVTHNGTTATSVYTNSGTPAASTLGTADTGSKAVPVPEEIGRLAAVLSMRLKVASQGAERTITAIFQRR